MDRVMYIGIVFTALLLDSPRIASHDSTQQRQRDSNNFFLFVPCVLLDRVRESLSETARPREKIKAAETVFSIRHFILALALYTISALSCLFFCVCAVEPSPCMCDSRRQTHRDKNNISDDDNIIKILYEKYMT